MALASVRNSVSVVASSPFLTVDQAAGELQTTPIHVLRLIARGALKAVQAGDTFKIRPADLDDYARKGSPDFDAPKFEGDGSWIDDPQLAGFGERFVDDVRRIIADSFLASIPRDGKGQIMTQVNLPVVGALGKLVSAPPYTPPIKFVGKPVQPSPFNRAAEQYAADQVRRFCRSLIRRELNPETALAGGTDLTRLYASPEEYARITKYAVQTFAGNAIGLGKEYPDPATAGIGGRTIRVTYRVPHAALGVDMSRVVALAL